MSSKINLKKSLTSRKAGKYKVNHLKINMFLNTLWQKVTLFTSVTIAFIPVQVVVKNILI